MSECSQPGLRGAPHVLLDREIGPGGEAGALDVRAVQERGGGLEVHGDLLATAGRLDRHQDLVPVAPRPRWSR